MTVRAHLNNFTTTLTEDITTVEVDIDVDDATGISALFTNGVDIVPITITDGTDIEIVHCTSVASNTITVLRGQEGTTGTAFLIGDTVTNRATAESVDQNKPHFMASAPSDVLTTGSANKVDFAVADVDPFGWFNTGSNRWQPTEPGMYYLEAHIQAEDMDPDSNVYIQVWNRTVSQYEVIYTVPDDAGAPPSPTETSMKVSFLLQLDGGSDYATIRVYHDGTGDKTYSVGCRFIGWKIN